jgi:iron complex outermembrane recepter protein
MLNAILFLLALLTAVSTHAEPIEEVVVTAVFRPVDEMAAAASVSVVGAQTMAARAAQHIEDVINTVPNLNYAGGTGRARFFQIRGIGELDQFVDPVNASVGVLIDNVDFSGIGSVATLFDADQVEVLRGPQGTHYGSSALAGLIKIKTNDPEDAFGTRFSLSTGAYGTHTAGVVITGPVGPESGFRIAAQTHRSDGYTTNQYLGRDDVNARDESTVRAKLRWTPGEASRIDVLLMHVAIDDGYDAFSLDNTRITLSDQPGHDRQTSNALAVDSQFQLPKFDLSLVVSLTSTDSDYDFDEGWTYVGIHPDGYSSTDNYLRDRTTRSLDARMTSNDTSLLFNGTTHWIAGAYILDSTEDLRRIYTWLDDDFRSRYDFTTSALYGQFDSRIATDLYLATGIRFERRQAHYADNVGIPNDPTETMWGGEAVLRYTPSSRWLTYAGVSRGYKAGGFNSVGAEDADLGPFASEFLWAFETGVKTTSADGQLQLRAALFYVARRDQQVKTFITRTRPNGSTEFVELIGNAARGTNMGVEVEANWSLSDNLSLFAGVGILRAKFDEYTNEFDEDLGGRDQAHAPTYMFSTGVDYVDGHWFGRVSADGKDSFYFSDRHAARSSSYVLLNASFGYETDRWQLSLWGRNLGNKDYFVRGFGDFGNDPRKGYIVEPYRQFGEPRVVGVSATWHTAQ